MLGSTSPAAGDDMVGATIRPSARFSEPVIGVSSTSMTLTIGAASVAGTVTYEAPTRTARFTPAAPLAPATVYTVASTGAIQDAHGNALAPQAWSFTTDSEDAQRGRAASASRR